MDNALPGNGLLVVEDVVAVSAVSGSDHLINGTAPRYWRKHHGN